MAPPTTMEDETLALTQSLRADSLDGETASVDPVSGLAHTLPQHAEGTEATLPAPAPAPADTAAAVRAAAVRAAGASTRSCSPSSESPASAPGPAKMVNDH